MSLQVKVAHNGRVGRAMPGVGDPGIFGTIGGIIGKVAGVASNIPGPIGWAGSAVSKLTTKAAQPLTATQQRKLAAGQPASSVLTSQQLSQFQQPMPTPGVVGTLQRFLPGGQTGYTCGANGAEPKGYHYNETSYFLKDGTFVPAGTKLVRDRKRNPLNPRAASKAIGRLESLKRATKRFNRITIRKAS